MVVAGSALALTVSGCQYTSEITTMKTYDPGDGVSAQIGALHVNDLLVISQQQGGPGNVLGLAINGSGQPERISVSTVEAGQQGGGSGAAAVDVPANGTAQLTSGSGQALSVPAVQVPPGAMVQLLVRSNTGQTVVDAPVLPAEGYYANYGPAGGGGSPTASPTQSPAQSPTQSPTQAPNASPTQEPAPTATTATASPTG